MTEPQKTNASGKGGATFTKLAGGVSGSKNRDCGVKHTSDSRRTLQQGRAGAVPGSIVDLGDV